MNATISEKSILPSAGNTESPQLETFEATNGSMQWSPSNTSKVDSRKSRRRSVRPQDIAEITSQLAIMTRSGIDISSALDSLANQCKRPALAQVLKEINESILAGNTLSDALRKHDHVFEASYIATVAAGEASGKMSLVLAQLAQMQRSMIRSQRTIRALMTYPILLMTVSTAVLIALVMFVLPRFADIFEQYDVPLPAITQLLLALAGELWTRWWLWGPLAVGSLTSLLLWRKTNHGRRTLDTLWVYSPVIRNVYRSQIVGRMCRLMGLMLQSGVPLVETLRLIRHALDNLLYKELLSDLEEAVVNGRSIESALADSEVLPQSAREMIVTAEKTGKMGEVTQLLGEHYEEEAEAGMRQLIGLLEPIITVGMGILIAGVVLAVMLPVFDLSTLAH